MTAQPSTPTHAMIVMEMLSVASRVGMPWVDVEDIAFRLYPAGRPAHYAESIRSTVHGLRVLLAEREAGIACEGRKYALMLELPGVFRSGAGFVRRPALKRRVQAGMQARFVPGAQRRAGR